MAEKIMDCPFCGIKPRVLFNGSVACENDECSTMPMVLGTMYSSKEKCIRGWNNRPHTKETKLTTDNKSSFQFPELEECIKHVESCPGGYPLGDGQLLAIENTYEFMIGKNKQREAISLRNRWVVHHADEYYKIDKLISDTIIFLGKIA